MKPRPTHILRIVIMLGVLLHLPGIVFSRGVQDTLVVERMFSYKRNFTSTTNGTTGNAYIKYNFRTIKRNPTLLLIPTMYYIAKGRRNYIGEVYGKITYNNFGNFGMNRQVFVSTIPHNHKTMPTVIQYISPNIYGVSIYKGQLLSPFNRSNRFFYRYRISPSAKGRSCITFKPRQKNTQLVKGFAIVDNNTGRIVNCRIGGEHDMVEFDVRIDMGEEPTANGLLPVSCQVRAQFLFAGNEIRANAHAVYNCDTTLPDSISNSFSPEAMDTLRPVALTGLEEEAYRQYRDEQATASDTTATTPKSRTVSKVAWDVFSEHFINSTDVETSNMSLSVSPLLNPLYLSYSRSHGIAYRLKLGAQYIISPTKSIAINPNLGYNFKIRQLFLNATARYTYNSNKQRWVELMVANGNRIANSSVLDKIKSESKDTINFDALNLNYFNDDMVKLAWNTTIGRRLNINAGAVYHVRNAINKASIIEAGEPTTYYSFAPFITATYTPYPMGPVITCNYERGVPHLLRSNTEYERWEFDASFSKRLPCMRRYSLRMGGGFYTNKENVYFVDFDNFHDNYLPGGWDDDWTGDFQLLNSQWYNASRYYLRANASYESPLIMLTWLPLVGKYIEMERFYLSTLQIEHTRPYFELGYGLTTRYFSVGLFGSFLNGNFHEFGSKFTFELFRKW